MFTVRIKHKKHGEIQLINITEIHYKYPSINNNKIAFESDKEETGYVYDVDDIIEFEAIINNSI